MKLSKRRIVLTGGTSGIGRELALLLAADNQVVVLARETTRSMQLQAEVPDIGMEHVDLSVPEEVEAVGRRLAGGPALDGLINCAALQNTPVLASPDFDLASIRREMDINLTAVCLLCATLLPALLTRQAAFIMNINSGLGLVPKTDSAVYCATKGGLNIFTQSLRNQLADTNVRVQQVLLPLVDTPMTHGRTATKLDARDVARQILKAVEAGTEDTDVGKVRLLRILNRVAPSIAHRIMQGA
ncbi:MAG: SDR family NAD(P)-dependent oxidoreductase [Minwuia sp.]|nr:SDR family NAD(P)-dependent oxidoreductase [Minwuia sp.]